MDEKEAIEKLAVKENQQYADIKAVPEYCLTHNKECSEFRNKIMQEGNEFDRGYLFGTACICNGAEDRILVNIRVTIIRTYTSGSYSLDTEQKGNIKNPALLKKLEKMVLKGEKIDPEKHEGFGHETAVESRFESTR